MQGFNLQSARFGRLSEFGSTAENKLIRAEGTRLFGREQLESKGLMIGSAVDWANNKKIRGRLHIAKTTIIGAPLEIFRLL